MDKELPQSGGFYVRDKNGKLRLVPNEKKAEPLRPEPDPVEPETQPTEE